MNCCNQNSSLNHTYICGKLNYYHYCEWTDRGFHFTIFQFKNIILSTISYLNMILWSLYLKSWILRSSAEIMWLVSLFWSLTLCSTHSLYLFTQRREFTIDYVWNLVCRTGLLITEFPRKHSIARTRIFQYSEHRMVSKDNIYCKDYAQNNIFKLKKCKNKNPLCSLEAVLMIESSTNVNAIYWGILNTTFHDNQ